VTPPKVSVHGSEPVKVPEVTVLLRVVEDRLSFRILRGVAGTFGVRVALPVSKKEEATLIGPTVAAVQVNV
jgi:hypothetical protein